MSSVLGWGWSEHPCGKREPYVPLLCSSTSSQKAVEALAVLPSRLVSWMADLAGCESSKHQALPPDLLYRQSAWTIFRGDFRWCETVVQWSRLIGHFFLNIWFSSYIKLLISCKNSSYSFRVAVNILNLSSAGIWLNWSDHSDKQASVSLLQIYCFSDFFAKSPLTLRALCLVLNLPSFRL